MSGSDFFRPKAGRFGIVPAFFASPAAGTLTANATTTVHIPTPVRKARFLRASLGCTTVCVDADGTMLATLYKYDASADAGVALTEAFNIESVVTKESAALTNLTTLTDAIRTVDTGDRFYISYVSNSAAVDTQPTELFCSVECAILE